MRPPFARNQQRARDAAPGESETRQHSVESLTAHHPIGRESRREDSDRIDARGHRVPPDQRSGKRWGQLSIGDRYADEREDPGRDPEQRAKAACSEYRADESRRHVKREIRNSKELLDSKDVRGNRAERPEDCSRDRVVRDSSKGP